MPDQPEPGPHDGAPGGSDPDGPDPSAHELRRQARRRRELDRLFGDVLPGVTRDETGPDERSDGGGDRDRWYSENRPPHHG